MAYARLYDVDKVDRLFPVYEGDKMSDFKQEHANTSGLGKRDLTRKGDYIETFSGIPFYVMDPKENEILLDDIIQALSSAPRYGGHARRINGFALSVAEHSIRVADYLYRKYGNKGLANKGLFHDASEAYLVDIPRPIKPELTNYKKIEEGVQCLIYEKFCNGIPNDAQKDLIKEADNVMLFAEAHKLMKSKGVGWADYDKYIKQALEESDRIEVWSHDFAAHQFRLTYDYYKV